MLGMSLLLFQDQVTTNQGALENRKDADHGEELGRNKEEIRQF